MRANLGRMCDRARCDYPVTHFIGYSFDLGRPGTVAYRENGLCADHATEYVAKRDRPADLQARRTALYRIFNAEGALLYVGISTKPTSRIREHINGKMWGDEAASRTITWHETRQSARAAESAAIKTENPIYNITHGPVFAKLNSPEGGLTVDECETAMRAWYPGWVYNGCRLDAATPEVHQEALARVKAWYEAKLAAREAG